MICFNLCATGHQNVPAPALQTALLASVELLHHMQHMNVLLINTHIVNDATTKSKLFSCFLGSSYDWQMSHQKWQLTGSRMTLEVCQMGVRRAVSRLIWSLFWFLCFIYVAPSSYWTQLPGVFTHPITGWEERVTMHKCPQKCSCSVNCWIAKLRVFLNYNSILFLKWISFLGRS